ncbi:TauD/TfdA dioxygenase family protein [Streptomyces sp. NPDC004044]
MSLHVDPVAPDFVTAVDGLDLSKPLGQEQVEEIEQLIGRYGVLVFHGQPLTEDEQVRFGEQFGPLNTGLQTKITNKVQKRLTSAALTDISNVDTSGNVADKQNKQAMMNVGNMFWHTDAAYENHPFCYSILAAQSAVSWGGETQYADLRDAYDSLDSRTQELLADKTGTFYSHATRNWLGMGDTETDRTAYPPVRWPLVRTHPISGRKVLWVDSKVTEISGMSVPEGRALVHELIEHIGQRERVYTHSWRPDDVVMWDNRSVLHRGRRFDLTERREMRRVSTVDDSSSLGEVPFASAAL